MKKYLGMVLSICMICALLGCSSTESKTAEGGADNSQIEQSENESKSDATDESEAVLDKTKDSSNSNSAVVYFTGTGNTEVIAQSIAEVLSVPIYKIEPQDEYTSEDLNYNDDNSRANKEQNDDTARPEIANDLSDVTKADTIYLGYPIWWGTNPKIIQTFLDAYDLSGKTVYTFCTSGGSGIETSVSNLQELYPEVHIVSGQRFETKASKDDILDWLDTLQ